MFDSYHAATDRTTESGRLDGFQAVEPRAVGHHITADPTEEMVEVVVTRLNLVIRLRSIVTA